VVTYEASHRILVHVTLDTERVQHHQPPHQVVNQPETHNIGYPVLVERLRQVEIERLTLADGLVANCDHADMAVAMPLSTISRSYYYYYLLVRITHIVIMFIVVFIIPSVP